MNYCLIENLNKEYKLPTDCKYVALTQEAIYHLDQRNLDYITFEDFYTSGEIRGDSDKFLIEQLKWFDEFDELLKQIYPLAKHYKLNLATIYYYWLKYMIDNIILTCMIIRRFIESTNPKEIIFINNYKEDQLKHWSHILHFQGVESTYSRLIEPICNDYGISFKRLLIENYHKVDEKEKTDFKHRVKNLFPIIYTIYNNLRRIIKTLKFLTIPTLLLRKEKTRMLFLTLHDNSYKFAKTFIYKPIKFYVFQKGKIQHMKYIIRNKSLKTNSIINTDKIDTNNYKDIYKWVNNKCELDISKIIETRIDKFINIICPQIIQMVPVFLDYYREEKINYIVTSYLFTIEEQAAIAAANIYNKTKTIYLHHGSDTVEHKSRYFYIVRFFDYYFTQTKGEADHENKIKNEFGKTLPHIDHINFK